ncbi:MAG TPA: TetR/AcrR family transcriptional regulator [Humisphaera sp.]
MADLFGVREVPKNARDRLLETAIDLFYTHGFHAVGLDRVIAETGVTKTTFYKHFESKDDLVAAAITRREEWERHAWSRAVREQGGPTPRGQLLALFDVIDVWFNDPSFHGCLFINAAVEFADPRDPVHVVAATYKRRARDGWRELAAAAGAADPDTFADLYATLVEGTMIMRHVHGRNDAARVTKPLAERLIEQYVPAGAAGE